jgi:HPt (histidine-containing phosphotransfer) domain-containing protein
MTRKYEGKDDTEWEAVGDTAQEGAPSAADKLSELKERYLSRLAENRAELVAVRNSYAAAEPERAAELLAEIRTIAHRLAGSGATFGFPKVSSAASTLDELSCECLAAPRDGPSPEILSLSEILLQTMEDALVNASRGTLPPA